MGMVGKLSAATIAVRPEISRARADSAGWTESEDLRLRILIAEGLTASQISIRMKKHRGSICGKARRLGLAIFGKTQHKPARDKIFVITEPPHAPLGKPKPDPITTATASIMELDETRCRWPIGETDQPDFGYCGRPADGRYCAEHTTFGRSKSVPSYIEDLDRVAKWATR
jgi:GcrA cell cycle regulator